MDIPSEWSTQKRPKSARMRPETTRKKARFHHEHQEPCTVEDLASNICKHILETPPSRLEANLSFETVLSNVCYRQILENLFGSDGPPTASVPILSKSYEEAYMRECLGSHERPCVMGAECECMLVDRSNPFVGTELLLPGEQRTTTEPQMCVLCCRKHTQKLFYDLLYSHTGLNIGLIQRYGVVVGVSGEYSRDATLVMPPTGPVQCMPFPSPCHCRAHYTVKVRNTCRYLIQNESVGFRLPPHDGASGA